MDELRKIMNDFEIKKNMKNTLVDQNSRNMSHIHFQKKLNSEVNAICLTSMTFDSVLTEAIEGLEHYETRCLWEISKAVTDGINVHYFSKRAVCREAIEHFFQVFSISKEDQKRISFYSVEAILNRSNLPDDLSDYVLGSEKVRAVFKRLSEKKNSYLECFVLTPKENSISKEFNLPTYWKHPKVDYFKTKSGNRMLLEGVTNLARGYRDLFTVEEVVEALMKLRSETHSQKFVIKLNDGVSGDGNGFVEIISEVPNEYQIRQALIETKFVSSKMTYTKFFREFAKLGGVVEEFIDGKNKRSPSVQIFLHPNDEFEILSSHEQILDETGARFLGAKFPALGAHRKNIISEAAKVAQKLLANKIYGIVGLDFLTTEDNSVLNTYLIELNLRKGGTTHPYWTAKAALGDVGICDYTGKFILGNKSLRSYQSNDNLICQNQSASRSLKCLMSKLEMHKLLFCHQKKKGVILHMLNSYVPAGKIGAIFIGETDQEIQEYEQSLVNLIG